MYLPANRPLIKKFLSIFGAFEKMFSVLVIITIFFSHYRLRRFELRPFSWMVIRGHMTKVIRENIKLVSWKGDTLDMSNSLLFRILSFAMW